MKFVSFMQYLDHAGIEFNHVRYKSQPYYRIRFWKEHKAFYKVYLLGNGFDGEYDVLEEELKNIKTNWLSNL